jgi:hypothetical protein
VCNFGHEGGTYYRSWAKSLTYEEQAKYSRLILDWTFKEGKRLGYITDAMLKKYEEAVK